MDRITSIGAALGELWHRRPLSLNEDSPMAAEEFPEQWHNALGHPLTTSTTGLYQA